MYSIIRKACLNMRLNLEKTHICPDASDQTSLLESTVTLVLDQTVVQGLSFCSLLYYQYLTHTLLITQPTKN